MFFPQQQLGPYVLIRKLGRGGFGEVWLSEKRSEFLSKKVAIKLPLSEEIDFEAIRQEATLWDKASGHPNVLPIIDADIVDGQVLIVSEYADGGSLADKLRSTGPFAADLAVEYIVGILRGLDFLHSRKIIHRDIKPQNILLQGNTPRLADFGISRMITVNSVSSMIIGTEAYLAPEAFEGKRNIATDLWAVGIVLYELLTNSLPFPQQHPSERMFAILTRSFEPLPNTIPSNLQDIINKALSKAPESRYTGCKEMLAALTSRRELAIGIGSVVQKTSKNQQRQETRTLVRSNTKTPPSPIVPLSFGGYVDQEKRDPVKAHGNVFLGSLEASRSSALGLSANVAAGLAYIPFCLIGVIMSIIILATDKHSKLARFHAIHSLLLTAGFFLTYFSASAVSSATATSQISGLAAFAAILVFLLSMGFIVGLITSCVFAFQGKIFKLPIIGNIADGWSNPSR